MSAIATNLFRCPICGKEYKHCPTCEKNGLYTWRNVACNMEHYIGHVLIEDYNNNTISKEKFVYDIKKSGLLEDNTLLPEIKSLFEQIIKDYENDMLLKSTQLKGNKKRK